MQSLDFAAAAKLWTSLESIHGLAQRNRGPLKAALSILEARAAAAVKVSPRTKTSSH